MLTYTDTRAAQVLTFTALLRLFNTRITAGRRGRNRRSRRLYSGSLLLELLQGEGGATGVVDGFTVFPECLSASSVWGAPCAAEEVAWITPYPRWFHLQKPLAFSGATLTLLYYCFTAVLLLRYSGVSSALLLVYLLLCLLLCCCFTCRQHTSAYVSIRQHTSAYVSIFAYCYAAVLRVRRVAGPGPAC
jgi:hypothetical protein